MAVYSSLVSKLLFPLHERIKGHHSVRKLRELEALQWQSPERIAQHQQGRLNDFLHDIYRHNAYYRNLFEQLGIGPERFNDDDVLAAIPVLTKDDIRQNQSLFLSEGASNPAFLSTSGSSGTPLRFAVGNERVSHDVAAKWRATRWWGVDIGDREAVIWGSAIELSGQGLVKTCRDTLFRSRLFPAQKLDKTGVADLFEQLQRYAPAMIYGYPSILSLLSEYAQSKGLKYAGRGNLKVIFCTAEKLYEHQRAMIESVFGAPVANGYGSRDAGFIAHDCPAGSLHICDEDIITEVLDADGQPCQPGEIGELVVTNLCTRDFPMLRYKTGDLAIKSQDTCECGRGLSVFQDVVGRSNDVLTSTDGGSVHGSFIGNVIREDAAVCHFQVIQQSPVQFDVNLVCYPEQVPDEQLLTRKLKRILGEDAHISIRQTAAIQPESTGKYKYIINRTHLAPTAANSA